MTVPTNDDWIKAWEFAHAAPPDRHSVRLVIDGIKNPGADVAVSLAGGYVVWQTWWVSWYPSDLPQMSCVFDAGQTLRRIHNFAEHSPLELRVEVKAEVDNPAEYESAQLELVTLPEAPL